MTPTSPYICDAVRQAEALHRDLFDTADPLTIRELLERQARTLHEAHGRGDERCCVQVGNWLRRMAGAASQTILADALTLDEMHETVAREHGYDGWPAVEALEDRRLDPDFERAVDAVVTGDFETLSSLLAGNPALAGKRSRFGHRATLLHYLAANGVETRRQKSPYNAVEVARFLIDAGADVHATVPVYGGAFDTMALLTTSAHPADAGVRDPLVEVLVDAGARAPD